MLKLLLQIDCHGLEYFFHNFFFLLVFGIEIFVFLQRLETRKRSCRPDLAYCEVGLFFALKYQVLCPIIIRYVKTATPSGRRRWPHSTKSGRKRRGKEGDALSAQRIRRGASSCGFLRFFQSFSPFFLSLLLSPIGVPNFGILLPAFHLSFIGANANDRSGEQRGGKRQRQ